MIWMQTASGRAFDLLEPTAEMVDLEVDVAEALARTARFGGHARSGPYSVAQHCVLGTDCILAQTGSLELARAFLLHDAHEAYIGDLTSPVVEALEFLCGGNDPDADGLFRTELHRLKGKMDRAIYGAAGATWPLDQVIAGQVKSWDAAMLMAERNQLLSHPPQPWDIRLERVIPAPLRGRIVVWPWPKAADEWRTRLHQLFPHLKPVAA